MYFLKLYPDLKDDLKGECFKKNIKMKELIRNTCSKEANSQSLKELIPL